nr:flagellar motor stator protein MotA [Psychromonas ingrahamii]
MIVGGNLKLLWKPTEILIIFGAGSGALIVGSSKNCLILITSQLKDVFTVNPYSKEFYRQLLSLHYQLMRVKKMPSGAKVLESHVEDYENSSIFNQYPLVLRNDLLVHFIVDNFRMTISSLVAAHEIDATLESEIEVITSELLEPAVALKKLADSLPGLGVLGAVMGIILTMQSIDTDIAMIGSNIATALIGTFLGVFGCYCLFDPLSCAVKSNVMKSIVPFEVVKQILVAHVSNRSPLLSIDSGRRAIEIDEKPAFKIIEEWADQLDKP